LGEAIIGLALFAMLSLAVVGILIQTARLDTKDTGLMETTFLADTLMEKRVSEARQYEAFRDLLATPAGEYWTLEPDRADELQKRYLYRVEINEPMPAMKRVVVSVYHRDTNLAVPAPDTRKGQSGLAVSVGTLLAEPAR
jgi:hypothetical protein